MTATCAPAKETNMMKMFVNSTLGKMGSAKQAGRKAMFAGRTGSDPIHAGLTPAPQTRHRNRPRSWRSSRRGCGHSSRPQPVYGSRSISAESKQFRGTWPCVAYVDVHGKLGGGVREEEVWEQLWHARVAAALLLWPRPGCGKVQKEWGLG